MEMEETITEDVADVEEPPEAKKPLEEIIEEGDATEPTTTDTRICKSELDGKNKNRYTKTVDYKKRDAREKPKNPPSKKAGLERTIPDSKSMADELGIDWTELLSAKLAQYPSWHVGDRDKKPAKKSNAKDEGREVHDSFDGAHVLIYHQDPETGKLYFAFEIKPDDYPIPKYAGRLSLYGGSIKIGEPPNDGLVRELKEEDPNSYKIVIRALNETRWKVAEITKHSDGVPSTTYIWAANIKDPIEWSKYLLDRTIEGDKTPKSLEEILGMKDSDFAWGFGPIVKGAADILSENYGKRYGYRPSYNLYSNNAFPSSTFHKFN